MVERWTMGVGDLFKYCNVYGIVLLIETETCKTFQEPDTWIKVGWASGETTWEELDANRGCFKVLSRSERKFE
tara:strand:- start:1190 stop:1408 length:219 start_codon:yes stop_codon:yes gene_type:complete